MLNLSDKELDRLSKEAAQEYDPGDVLGPDAWEKLQVRLDADPGGASPNPLRHIRRWPFYYAPALLVLLGISYYYLTKHPPGSDPLAKTVHSTQNSNYPATSTPAASSSARPGSSQASRTGGQTGTVDAGTHAAGGAGTHAAGGAGTHAAGDAGAHPQPNAAAPAPGATATNAATTPPGSSSASSATTAAGSAPSPPAAINSASSANDLTRNSHRLPNSGSSRHNNHLRGNGNNAPENGNNAPRNGNYALRNGNNALRDASQLSGNPGDLTDHAGDLAGHAGAASGNPAAATSRELVRSTIQGPIPTKRPGFIDDSALRAFSLRSAPPPPIRERALHIKRNWQFGFVLAPDFASVNSLAGDKPGSIVGLTVDYQFAPRWYLGSGLLVDRKNYAARSEDFHAPQWYYGNNNINPLHVDFFKGSFSMLEIPLNLRYDFSVTGNTLFFASAGVSSYLLAKDNGNCYYEWFGQEFSKGFQRSNLSNYLFSSANLSVGVETGLSNSLSVLVAPYMKMPLSSMGFGQVQMSSVGINFSLKWSPVTSIRRR